ncbi:MAG: hypothetical protein ACI8ZF_000686 [Candidatus Midichloriaceae bacterium]|jgi:hypothetical protein
MTTNQLEFNLFEHFDGGDGDSIVTDGEPKELTKDQKIDKLEADVLEMRGQLAQILLRLENGIGSRKHQDKANGVNIDDVKAAMGDFQSAAQEKLAAVQAGVVAGMEALQESFGNCKDWTVQQWNDFPDKMEAFRVSAAETMADAWKSIQTGAANLNDAIGKAYENSPLPKFKKQFIAGCADMAAKFDEFAKSVAEGLSAFAGTVKDTVVEMKDTAVAVTTDVVATVIHKVDVLIATIDLKLAERGDNSADKQMAALLQQHDALQQGKGDREASVAVKREALGDKKQTFADRVQGGKASAGAVPAR